MTAWSSWSEQPSAVGSSTLIVFAGLPGVGKTIISGALAREIAAVYLRIDSIEQTLRESAALVQPINDAGYRVAYALAENNLRMGRTVVADCVNPILITRKAWRDVADRARARIFEIELQCSDVKEHRRRVESRSSDIQGLVLPTWNDVLTREYQPWDRKHLEIDTATNTPNEALARIRRMLQG